ncbi:NAD(P)-dependent dehydrogenase (short-subunit alcohol dehydrogenase family) [Streptomyces aurantiacus]|uniref:SDR family NAD(P)-dependent oxidoreductase n=1 Tax=Streptomyces aurantiacus TaxID=47760 RepID=UPI00278E2322|nr:SDR family NAD(P)-dependent oxidoreductase [Streptomyces aurantiacus]MDQ0773929.1 NAD(P)-dependent dehydrogenase (short-subunit alcohol dehydrogenase family) [Streptomyces aurantiacus]
MIPVGDETTQDGGEPMAIVTGAARGLGFHLADELACHGFRTVCVVRNPSDAVRLRELGHLVRPVVGDVTDVAVGRSVARNVGGGAVGLLIHNAGVGHPPRRLRELGVDDVLDSFVTHCLGPLRLTQALLPALRRSPCATVVHVSSRWGSFAAAAEDDGPGGKHYAYRIGKAAQNMMSLCLRQELAGLGIRVVAVHPGALRTAMGAPDAQDAPSTAAADLVRLLLTDPREGLPPFTARAGDPHPW